MSKRVQFRPLGMKSESYFLSVVSSWSVLMMTGWCWMMLVVNLWSVRGIPEWCRMMLVVNTWSVWMMSEWCRMMFMVRNSTMAGPATHGKLHQNDSKAFLWSFLKFFAPPGATFQINVPLHYVWFLERPRVCVTLSQIRFFRKTSPSVALIGKDSKNKRMAIASRSFIFWPIWKICLQKKVGSKNFEIFRF